MRQSDCQKYMRRIKRSGCACRSAGAADTVHDQASDQHGLTLDELEADVNVVRKSLQLCHRSVWCMGSQLVQAVDQVISQFDFFFGTLFHGFCIARSAAAPYPTIPGTFSVPARRLRSCAPPCTKDSDLYAFTDIQETDSFRSVQLVSAGAQHINVAVRLHRSEAVQYACTASVWNRMPCSLAIRHRSL